MDAQHLNELLHKAQEARKDTERLNWLDCSTYITSVEAAEIVNGHRWQGRVYNSIRDAIDAAMSSDAERGEK